MHRFSMMMEPKRVAGCYRPIDRVPEEVLQVVFASLPFTDKCKSCLVCSFWNRILRAPNTGLWKEVLIDLAKVTERMVEPDRWQDFCKWLAFRSAGIQKVRLEAKMTLVDDNRPIKELVQVLNDQFAFLAGALTWTGTPLYFDLYFKGQPTAPSLVLFGIQLTLCVYQLPRC